jgi:hypothetical protein
MTPIIAASFEPNGSVVIAISVANRRTSNSSTIKTTAIATLKEKLRSRRYKKRHFYPFFLPRNSNFPTWITSRMERSRSSASSGAIGSWISLGKILRFPKNLFTLMSGLRSSPSYSKSRFIWEKNWLRLLNTNCPLGSP